MNKELVAAVHLDVEIGDRTICTDIGTITVPAHDEAETRKQLGSLLKAVGEHILDTGEVPYLTKPSASTPGPA